MSGWQITGVDPDRGDEARGLIATVDGTRAEAILRGCEAAVDGYVDVQVEGCALVFNIAQ